MKQRQRSSQRSRDSEEETRSERSITAAPSERAAGLSLSRGGLLYLCVPLILSGLYVQQGWRLSEVEQKYEALLERSRSSDQMEEKMEEISAQLQASADAVSHLSELHRSVSSIFNTSADLRVERKASAQHTHTSAQHTHTLQQLTEQWRSAQMEQEASAQHTHTSAQHTHTLQQLTEQWRSTQMEHEASAQHAHTLQQRLHTLTELWRSRRAEAGAELHTLQTQTRAAHAQLTQQINAAEASVSELKERLTELQAGIGRNARALGRTEQEDTHHLQELLQRHTHRLALLQQQADMLTQHTHRLTEQVEDCAQHTHSWQETQRPRVEECVRALLKLRAQMKSVYERVSELQQGFSSLSLQSQQLRQNVSSLALSLQDMDNHSSVLWSGVSSSLSSIRTDVRRVSGLQMEVQDLLQHTSSLQEEQGRLEKLMVRRVGDLLADSISRVSAVRSSAESHAQRLQQLHTHLQQLSSTQHTLSTRMLELQSTQATLRRSASYSADLQPTLRSTHTRLNTLETRLDELTLRIGHIAHDILHYNIMQEPRGDIINNTMEEEHRGEEELEDHREHMINTQEEMEEKNREQHLKNHREDMTNTQKENQKDEEHLENDREDIIDTEDNHLENHRQEEHLENHRQE